MILSYHNKNESCSENSEMQSKQEKCIAKARTWENRAKNDR